MAEPANQEQIQVMYDPTKVIPKLVTKIGIAKTESNNYIVSLISDIPNESASLVERVVIDEITLDKLVEALNLAKDFRDEK